MKLFVAFTIAAVATQLAGTAAFAGSVDTGASRLNPAGSCCDIKDKKDKKEPTSTSVEVSYNLNPACGWKKDKTDKDKDGASSNEVQVACKGNKDKKDKDAVDAAFADMIIACGCKDKAGKDKKDSETSNSAGYAYFTA